MWRPEIMLTVMLSATNGLTGELNEPAAILPRVVGPIGLFLALYIVSFAYGCAQGLRAQRLSVKVGKETMLGRTVNALTSIDARGGKVFVEGEYWNSTSDTPVEKGALVQITAVEGLTLKVKLET
jgi:membrane-bound ClpP family serine protease